MTQRGAPRGTGGPSGPGGGPPPEVERGVVEATNDKGLKLGGRWLNYSQFRQVPHPETGQEVEVEIVRDRFINALTVIGAGGDLVLDLEESESISGDAFEGLDADAAPAPRPRRPATPAAPARPLTPGPDRNTEIRRLALIKAAAEYAAPRTDMTPDDVLTVAIQWEAWVTDTSEATE